MPNLTKKHLEKLRKRFTRTYIRSVLQQLTEYYLQENVYQVQHFASWLLEHGIPVKFIDSKFKIVDSEFETRFIPEEDEDYFDILNEIKVGLYRKHAVFTIDKVPHTEKAYFAALKLITYFELKGYTLKENTMNFTLLGIDEN